MLALAGWKSISAFFSLVRFSGLSSRVLAPIVLRQKLMGAIFMAIDKLFLFHTVFR